MSEFKEKILLNAIFPLADTIMGTCAMKWYRQIKEMNTWSKDQIYEWQLDKLHSLVDFSYNHTAYYKKVFDESGLSPADIRDFADLEKLPVLTREIINDNFDDIKPDVISKYKHRVNSTSGSSGTPLKFICGEETWGFVTGMKIYSWQQMGYHYGDLFVTLTSAVGLFANGKPSLTSKIYFRLRNTIPLNGVNMSPEICSNYMDIIKKYRPKYIYGYASAIYLFACYCKENNINYHFDAVFTTSEKLVDNYRNVIEHVFSTTVMDCYGSRDGAVTGYEVNRGSYNVGYAAYLEASSEMFSPVYSTNLIDYAFPLIRYSNRDELQMMPNDKITQYNGQVISDVVGRTSDILHFANGHSIAPTGFCMIFRGMHVDSFRVKQTGDMTVLFELVTKQGYNENEEKVLREALKKHIGNDVEITFKYMSNFEPLKNGKRSFIMNDTSIGAQN